MGVDEQKREVPLSCAQGTHERLLGRVKRVCGLPEVGVRYPGAGVAGGCGLPEVGPGN